MVQFCGVCVCVCVCVACVYNVCISGLFKRYIVEKEICVIHTMAKYIVLVFASTTNFVVEAKTMPD